MKRSPIRKVSVKRAKEMRAYLKARREFLDERFCEWPDGCIHRAHQVHHANGREGQKLLDQNDWIGLCGFHHEAVHKNPNAARKIGMLK